MTTNQLNQLDMYLLVNAIFGRFQAIWNTNTRLTTAINQFTGNLATIETQKKAQEEQSTGIAQDKKTLKEAIAKKAAFIAGGIRAYAFSISNQALEESSLKTMREAMLPTACQLILDKAQTHLAQLGDEGITAATLTELSQLVKDFAEKKTKPQEAINDSKEATATLAELFSSNSTMLKKQLDGLMAQYEETAPDFYRAYLNARPINSRGQRGKGDNGTTPPQG
jgi:ABC-type transporter Mla subunit MlaD